MCESEQRDERDERDETTALYRIILPFFDVTDPDGLEKAKALAASLVDNSAKTEADC